MKKTVLGVLLLIASSLSATETYTWGSVCIGGGGFVSAIITSPSEKNLIFARTDVGGAYRWNEAEHSWIPLNDWLSADQTSYYGIESMAIDPQSPNKVYMSVGTSYWNNGITAVLRSQDYGDTWAITDVTSLWKSNGNGMGRQTGEKLAVDPNNGDILFCGTRANGLFKSTDGAVSWENVASLTVPSSENGVAFVLFDKNSGSRGNATQTIYIGTSNTSGDNLFISKDGGAGWSPITGGPAGFMPNRSALTPDGKILYIAYANGPGPWSPYVNAKGYFYKYDIQANTFTDLSPQDFHSEVPWGEDDPYYGTYGGISIDAANPQRLLISTMNAWKKQSWECYGDKLFLSEYGGTTWSDLFDENRITMNENGYGWIKDHSIHWASSIEIDPFNPERAFVSSGNGIFMTENLNDAVGTWKFMVRGLEETVPEDIISIPGGPLLSVIADYDGFLHDDIKKPPKQRHSPAIGSSTGIAYATQKPEFVVRSGGDGTMMSIYFSEDAGKTWTPFAGFPEGDTCFKGYVAVSADGAAVLWKPTYSTGQGNKTYRTTDLGATWTLCSGLTATDYKPIADPVNPAKFYAFDQSGASLYISSDGGKTFAKPADHPNFWSASKHVVLTPDREGDIWLPHWSALGRYKTSDGSYVRLDNVSGCDAVGFGKAAPDAHFPTIYIWGKVETITGVFRSIDEGATWERINDDAHQFGSRANGGFIKGDMNVFGRVYMSTAGRGIVYGEIYDTSSISNGYHTFAHKPLTFRTMGARDKCFDLRGRVISRKRIRTAHGVMIIRRALDGVCGLHVNVDD